MPSAFRVAAGVINPVTGRWMTKTWNFDQILPEAVETYRAIEQQFGIQVYRPIPELRLPRLANFATKPSSTLSYSLRRLAGGTETSMLTK